MEARKPGASTRRGRGGFFAFLRYSPSTSQTATSRPKTADHGYQDMRLRQARKIANRWPVNPDQRWNKAWVRIRKAARNHHQKSLAMATKYVIEWLAMPIPAIDEAAFNNAVSTLKRFF